VLNIGGLTPCTTIDYPDHLAAVVFCQGCPWRCGYCHNRALLDATTVGALSWPDLLSFLERRQGLLDAVVFSGGEPTLQEQLPAAVAAVRQRGFLVGLHTAGPYPERLALLLPHLDWVGMDLKAPFAEYDAVTGVAGSGEGARQSALLLRESGVSHQFRTTLDPFLLTNGRLAAMERMVAEEWGSRLVVQPLSR
jgi:pyruvate formate lyase activating enzyme